MRRIIFILLYACAGLYIAWDSTVLFSTNSSSPSHASIHPEVEENTSSDVEYIQASYSVNGNVQEKLAAENIFFIHNDSGLIPFKSLSEKRFFLMTLGPELKAFEEHLGYYASVLTDEIVSVSEANVNYLGYYNPVIFAINQSTIDDSLTADFLQKLSKRTEVVLVNFQSSDVLSGLDPLNQIVQVKNASNLNQGLAAQALFGGIASFSRPDSSTELDPTFDTSGVHRLAYGLPEMKGLSSEVFAEIDHIVNAGIADSAMPGCQVLIAHKGMVIYNKALGYHTYEKKIPVSQNDLYDIASITKVAATTLGAMRLYEEGKLELDLPLYRYFSYQLLPEPIKVWDTVLYEDFMVQWEASPVPMVVPAEDTIRYQDTLLRVARWENIGEPKVPALFQLSSRDFLTHTSGLPASLSLPGLYSFGKARSKYAYRWRSPYFRRHSPLIDQNVWLTTLQTPTELEGFNYSDLNLMVMRRLIDSLTNVPFSQYLKDNFYQEIGLQHTQFNPQESFKLKQIVPTEYNVKMDTLIHGIVHDPVAALMGGVAGHAGLFANANDLAILFQMLLNKGAYGGVRYFSPKTVKTFTRRQGNLRGLGFDKPPLNRGYVIARSASENSFGHTGFSGTCVWADPDHDLVFVFLSNRIHPNIKNHKLSALRIRERVHQVAYKALGIPPRSFQWKSRKYAPVFTRTTPEEEEKEEAVVSTEVSETR